MSATADSLAHRLDVHGAPMSLTAVRAGRPAVVVLYRGGVVPVLQLHAAPPSRRSSSTGAPILTAFDEPRA